MPIDSCPPTDHIIYLTHTCQPWQPNKIFRNPAPRKMGMSNRFRTQNKPPGGTWSEKSNLTWCQMNNANGIKLRAAENERLMSLLFIIEQKSWGTDELSDLRQDEAQIPCGHVFSKQPPQTWDSVVALSLSVSHYLWVYATSFTGRKWGNRNLVKLSLYRTYRNILVLTSRTNRPVQLQEERFWRLRTHSWIFQ